MIFFCSSQYLTSILFSTSEPIIFQTWFCGENALELEKHSNNEKATSVTKLLRRFAGIFIGDNGLFD